MLKLSYFHSIFSLALTNTPAHSTAHFDEEFENLGGFSTGGFGGATTPAGSTRGGNRFGGNTPMSELKKLITGSILVSPRS